VRRQELGNKKEGRREGEDRKEELNGNR